MSVTEDTVTNLVAEYLRSQGVDVLTQISNTVSGRRNQPDFQVSNGGVFYGEAKWESNKWEGLGEARDYGVEIGGAEGTFLIAYPDQLRSQGIQTSFDGDLTNTSLGQCEFSVAFLRRREPTDMRSVTLAELPNWIESNIKQRTRPQVDTSEAIDYLRQLAIRFNDELKTAPEENLFRNVLGTSTADGDEQQAARETAGFLLVNQLTFYRVLSYHIDALDEIDPTAIDAPSDLSDYFDQVLEMDYTPVYKFKIANDLPRSASAVVEKAVDAVNGLTPENITHDVLGKVFHELIPRDARKKIAAYYTKNGAADMLTDLAIESADDRVMDPACGSGTLLASSYKRKRELWEGGFTEADHQRFVEDDLTGIDVMPFAAHLSCIHLALQAPVYETDEVNIGIADSTTLNPGDMINPLSFVLPESEQQRDLDDYTDKTRPDLDAEMVESGSMTVDADAGRQMQLTYSDVIVMNPPFSRAQSVARFSPNYKEKLEARFSRRERQIHGKMSYFSYFFFLADRFLEEDGRIAVVCPMTVLNKESDHGVREMLVEEYTVEYIFAREDAANYSEDTDFREVLIVARKGCDHEDEGTAFVSHDGFGVDVNEIRATAEEIDVGETAYRDEYTVQCISLDDLNLSNLFAPFSVANPEVLNGWEAVANDIPLTSLQSLRESRPRIRGIGTNADGVMHVHPEASINDPAAHKFDQDDVYVTERETADSVVAKHRHTGDTFSIPRDHLVPNLRRYPGRSKANLSGIPEYAILDDNWDGGNRYMSLTDEPTIPDKWASRVRRRLGHVSLVRRVNLTAPGTHHLAYYSDEKRLYPSTMWVLPPFTSEEAKVLAAWFDSSFGWLQSIVYRTVTEGGMCDWRGYTIDEFRVPQLTSLAGDSDNGGTHQDLIDAFDAVKDIDHPSLAQQLALNAPPDQFSTEQINRMDNAFENISDDLGRGFEARRTLDESILSLAGMPDEQQDDFLDAFYADLFLELVALKRIMDS